MWNTPLPAGANRDKEGIGARANGVEKSGLGCSIPPHRKWDLAIYRKFWNIIPGNSIFLCILRGYEQDFNL